MHTITPKTWHPGRCYCGQFAPGHQPGMTALFALTRCIGDTHRPHIAPMCPACIAGATDGPTSPVHHVPR